MFILALTIGCIRDIHIGADKDPAELESALPVDSDPADTPDLPPDTDVPPDSDSPPVAAATPPQFVLHSFLSDLQWPESVDWDPGTSAFYVGSLSEGHLLKVAADGTESVFYSPPITGWQTWGVAVDAARRRVYTCASYDGVGPDVWQLWLVDLDLGSLIASYDMSDSSPGAACRDMVIDGAGRAFITDREHGQVHRLHHDTGLFSVWSSEAPLEPHLWGGDGIELTPDGNALLIGMARPPGIVRVSLIDPTAVTRLDIDPTAFQLQASHGLDGMVMLDGRLIIAGANRLVRVTPTDPQWSGATVESFPADLSGMSGVAIAEGAVYAVNGDPLAWTLSIRADLPFELYQLVLPP